NGRQCPASIARAPRQTERGKIIKPRRNEFELRQFPEIQRGQRIRHTLRPGDRVLNRETHVRVTELREDGTIRKFHHRMHDALRMDHYLHAFHLHAEEPVRLYHLESFIKERRRIDRDFWPHVPGRMPQRLLDSDRFELLVRRVPKRPPRRRQNQPPHVAFFIGRWTFSLRIEALKDRIVLAIDRQYLNTLLPRRAHHDLPRHHQNLLARHREILPCLNFRQRRPQPTRPNDRDQHHLRFIEARDFDQSILA